MCEEKNNQAKTSKEQREYGKFPDPKFKPPAPPKPQPKQQPKK